MNQLQQVIDRLLQQSRGLTLAIYLADKRDEGLSWERIAKQLYSETDGVVDVTWQTIRRWHDELVEKVGVAP